MALLMVPSQSEQMSFDGFGQNTKAYFYHKLSGMKPGLDGPENAKAVWIDLTLSHFERRGRLAAWEQF